MLAEALRVRSLLPLLLLSIAITRLSDRARAHPRLARAVELGTREKVTSVYSFSPDGTRVLSVGQGTVTIRDANTGIPLVRLDNDPTERNDPALYVEDADWSPNGTQVVAITLDDARLWDARTGELLAERSLGPRCRRTHFTADGRILTFCDRDDSIVDVWTPGAGSFEIRASAWTSALSPDGNELLAGDRHGLRVWDTRTGELRADLPAGDVYHLAWLPGKRAAVIGYTGLAVWDLAAHNRLFTLDPGERAWLARATPDGDVLLVGYYDLPEIRAYSLRTGQLVRSFPLARALSGFDLTRDGRFLVTNDGTVQVWDVATGATIRQIGTRDATRSFMISPDTPRIATAGTDGIARIWDLESGAREALLGGHTDGITDVVFSPSGDSFVTMSARFLTHDRRAALWDATTGKLLAVFPHEWHVEKAAFSPDGHALATASAFSVHLWNVATGEHERELFAHRDQVTAVAYSRDGSTILSASRDGTARLWDAHTGGLLRTLAVDGPVLDAKFSPDGALVITADARGLLQVWRASDGTQVLYRLACPSPAYSVELDHTGRTALVSCAVHSVVVDVTTDTQLALFEGSDAHVSTDGTLVSTSDLRDGFANVYDIAAHNRLFHAAVAEPYHYFFTRIAGDGAHVLVTDDSAVLSLWDLHTGTELDRVSRYPKFGWGFALDPRHPSRFIIHGEDGGNQNATGALAIYDIDQGARRSITHAPSTNR